MERMVFEKIEQNKKRFLSLLLLADPDENMVDRYLDKSDLFIALCGDEIVAEAVVDRTGEIRNLAVNPVYQRQGMGKRMLDYLCEQYTGQYDRLEVGTSHQGIEFYERCGFSLSRKIDRFFIENYPEPIFDNGEQCIDLFYLSRSLK